MILSAQTSDTHRRQFLACTATAIGIAVSNPSANAAVGTLPEFSDTNAVLQGLTVNVADQSQQQAMIRFLIDSFDMKILRQRIQGPVEEAWLGYGPEQLSIPNSFTLPVSSFAEYGGHASIRVVYDNRAKNPLYRVGDASPPGSSIAYVQLGVPGYRISQMVKNGGNILDAYGIVNVISPSGLPIRGIVGIHPDPIMFVAINCDDVRKSQTFYETLGFSECEYPYARPNKGMGQFEPPQPSKSVYMAPASNGLGVLLLPSKKRVTPNPVVDSLGIVYTPPPGADPTASPDRVTDPSGISISFTPVPAFEAEEKITR